MIAASRFIASSDFPDEWHAARAVSVTATTVSKCSTPSGMAEYLLEIPFADNEYMAWGRLMEPQLARWAKREHALFENKWLIAHEARADFAATTDALSLSHHEIGEFKTTGDPWDGAETNINKVPIQYRRQAQWQLFVTGAERCLFAWFLRCRADDGTFYTPWLEPRATWLVRDESMMADLVGVAENLLEIRRGQLQPG